MKYFFFDIDGTLVPFGRKEPPVSTVNAIHSLRMQGNKVFISTGRGYYLQKGIENIERDGLVFCDGAGVEIGGELKLQRTIRNEIVHEIMEAAERTGVGIRLVGLHEFFVNDAMQIHNMNWLVKMPESERDYLQHRYNPLYMYQDEPVFKVECWYPEESDTREFVYEMAGRVNMIEMNSIDGNRKNGAEITALDVSKGTAVLLVVTHYHGGIEESYGFGDSMNDIELIKTAGHGIAMGNAVDELKQEAEYVTADVEDDGILKALQHYQIL